MSVSMNSPDRLEIRALQQRERIHRTAQELISKVDHAKEQLTPAHQVRQHFAIVSLVAAALSFLCGYAAGSAFTQR